MKKVVGKGFDVLREIISPENVLEMAELLAIKSTKCLSGWIGEYAYKIHTNLYADIMNKNNKQYVFSNSYDLVQSVALFLCEHFGEHVDDFYRISQTGSTFTIRKECYQIVDSIVCKGYRRTQKFKALEDLSYSEEPRYELPETTDVEQSYRKVEEIITAMDLTEMQASVLNYRMSGASFPEIGRYLNRCQSTVFEHLGKIRVKYLRYMEGLQ